MAKASAAHQTPELSYPKERIRVLLLESIHSSAEAAFKAEGYHVDTLPGALSEAHLVERLPDIHILGIRSATKLTASALEAAGHLLVVGAFCIGTNQIDLPAASRNGTAVFNAPYSNTRSVVELAIGEIIMLMRHTFERSTEMHAGTWNKTAAGSYEVRGKRLGIVGYGNIGSQLSVVAEALGMEVWFHDVADRLAFGNAKRASSLTQLLQTCDVVTIHVDGRSENKGLIGKDEFAAMKSGALFLNLSRGFVVDDVALAHALKSGHLAGAAADVFPQEPGASGKPFESPLRTLPNIILTPHVASGTQEAQQHVGQFVSSKLTNFINSGNTDLSVNLPNLNLPEQGGRHRLIHIHRNEPGVLASINAIVSESGANVAAQYLGTAPDVGYVIIDLEKDYSGEVKRRLAKLPETIRVRLLY
jgi:D-3-phosphoglycerate dehydrogenase